MYVPPMSGKGIQVKSKPVWRNILSRYARITICIVYPFIRTMSLKSLVKGLFLRINQVLTKENDKVYL